MPPGNGLKVVQLSKVCLCGSVSLRMSRMHSNTCTGYPGTELHTELHTCTDKSFYVPYFNVQPADTLDPSVTKNCALVSPLCHFGLQMFLNCTICRVQQELSFGDV
eukprot:532720-Rhodomonas_salina.1